MPGAGDFSLCVFILLVGVKLATCSEGYLWHLTDNHIDVLYESQQESCRDEYPPDELGRFGMPSCDCPVVFQRSFVAAMKSLGPSPEFIIWTGDMSPHVKNESAFKPESVVISSIRNVSDLIREHFPTAKVFPALGNNDCYPKNQLQPNNSTLYTAVGEVWRNWISDAALETFHKGGYYSGRIRQKENILILNTNLWMTNNQLTQDLDDPASQFKWMEDEMKRMKEAGEKAHIAAHIPLGNNEDSVSSDLTKKFSDRFNEIIVKYSDVIIGQYYGHTHSDTMRIIKNKSGDAIVGSALISPATCGTSWYGGNPTLRMIKYETTDFKLTDIWQYYLNLTKANADPGNAEWELEYKFTEAYGVNDITTASLTKVVEGFKTTNIPSFAKFIRYQRGLSTYKRVKQTCDADCKKGVLCGIENVWESRFKQCHDNVQSSGHVITKTGFYTCILIFLSSLLTQ